MDKLNGNWDIYLYDLNKAATELRATRPTAVNLMWAIDRSMEAIAAAKVTDRAQTAKEIAGEIKEETHG